MKKLLKNKKAITLIALVITIVILIILAGVAISLTLGNNGLFNKAKEAKGKYQNAQMYEEEQIAKVSNEIESYVGSFRGNITFKTLWSGLADTNGSQDSNGNAYSFGLDDIQNYKFILIQFESDTNQGLSSEFLDTSLIHKNTANNICHCIYGGYYVYMHFVDNGFVIDGKTADEVPRKIYGINF